VRHGTYSIVALDPATGALAVAGARGDAAVRRALGRAV
jgi:hypothetical protein